ncbi:glycosyltransferase [Granulicella sp. dw_53]|uniref:glycosyltransferase n=1 Tax=Granulicella sp. dw_53 TaxID=2719792 RepID=UPI001BD4F9AD|nr:glycosyltransferase [Granulicella sp. dw_53]
MQEGTTNPEPELTRRAPARPPRVAYFPDSFHEVNGVAHTSRNFVAYAQRHRLPFLCVRAGKTNPQPDPASTVQTLELPRGFASVGIEKDLAFDPLFGRHLTRVERELIRFKPDIIHITGPSELGLLGAWFASELGVPLAASWHTNVHEYAARRLSWLTSRLPARQASLAEARVESATLWTTAHLYRLAKVLFAPNRELCDLLEHATHRPCHLMQRGVDTALFSPARRTRPTSSGKLVLGYVGRLSIEKNVALLPLLERQLADLGIHDVQFLIIGHGSEEASLRAALPAAKAEFAGVLRGEALSTAYANMDLLVFPSHTDTFGNVVLEALASGVPAIVTPGGGPKYIVQQGETGFIAPDEGFTSAIATLAKDPSLLHRMRENARAYALTCSWDAVFHRVYDAYQTALRTSFDHGT